ncbi:MAG: hypothetical protein ABSH41_05600 [Syntrophobacteraceae bacterium]
MTEPSIFRQMIEPSILLCFWTLVLAIILVFKRPKGLKTHFWRFVLVYGLSLFGAISMGALSLVISNLSLPKSDMAYSSTILGVLHDPFARNGMYFFTIPIGVALSPFYFICTLEKNLFRCAVLIHSVPALAVAAMSIIHPFFAMIGSLPVVIGCLGFCSSTKLPFFSPRRDSLVM